MSDDNKPTVHFEGRDIAASKWLQLISDRQGTTPTTYTMFDPMTGQVFGRGLTQEQVRQCVIDNVLVRTPEEEDDDGRGMMCFRTRPYALATDEFFERIKTPIIEEK
jgi:hypothetical protein